jgi:REP element-mobilizing transposase RayT
MTTFLPGSKALRIGRTSIAGQVYLVTFVTSSRRPLFLDETTARTCVDTLLDTRSWTRSRLLAWVLMPDHWHGLVHLGEGDDLSNLVRRLKASSSRRVRLARPDIAGVWERGFHDRALRHEDGLVDLARYVVMNPVRARLVRRMRDYPYWDAIWCKRDAASQQGVD